NVFEIPAILKSESGWTNSSASRLAERPRGLLDGDSAKPYPRASIRRPWRETPRAAPGICHFSSRPFMKSSKAESWGTETPVVPSKATPKHSGNAISLVAVQNLVRKGILISYLPLDAATPPLRDGLLSQRCSNIPL